MLTLPIRGGLSIACGLTVTYSTQYANISVQAVISQNANISLNVVNSM